MSPSKSNRVKDTAKLVVPLLCMAVMLVLHSSLANTVDPKTSYDIPFYSLFLEITMGVYVVFMVLTWFSEKVHDKMLKNCWIILVIYVFFFLTDLGAAKLGFFNNQYVPTPDEVFGGFCTNIGRIFSNLASSAQIWICGIALGLVFGLVYGVIMGWSRIAYYWLFPFIEVIGPIPSSIWMVLAVVLMPTPALGGMFLIALSVWFPLAFNLGSAIRNIDGVMVERARILGASNMQILFKVALPSSVPAIFSGMFMGICFSFGSLISAELLGVSQGIGFLVNFYSNWAQFDMVYACMVLIIIIIFLVIECLFQIQDRVLKWQKGVLRW